MSIETKLEVRVVPPGADVGNPYPEVDRWLVANKDRNGYDPGVLKYPSTLVLEVGNGTTFGYLPIQSAVVLESLGLRDTLSPVERAQATMNLCGAAIQLAATAGKREAYMVVTDEVTARAAMKAGFQLLPYSVLRLKFQVDAEGKVTW